VSGDLPAPLPDELTLGRLTTKGMDTRFGGLTSNVYLGEYDNREVLVYALLDGDMWIAFVVTWNGEWRGEPWPFARYYLWDQVALDWVLTNYDGYEKFIEEYVAVLHEL
jgi:hypothetical protein